LLLLNYAGFYIFFHLQVKINRQEMRAQLKKRSLSQLECIILTDEEYRKVKVEEHELKINGRMFDIAQVNKADNVVWVYGLYDAKEDSLLALMDDVLTKPVDNRHVPAQVFDFLSWTYVIPQAADFSVTHVSACPNTVYREAYREPVAAEFIQPPEYTPFSYNAG
jgi:hypothetical protein